MNTLSQLKQSSSEFKPYLTELNQSDYACNIERSFSVTNENKIFAKALLNEEDKNPFEHIYDSDDEN